MQRGRGLSLSLSLDCGSALDYGYIPDSGTYESELESNSSIVSAVPL
jgi:hypothetical protein